MPARAAAAAAAAVVVVVLLLLLLLAVVAVAAAAEAPWRGRLSRLALQALPREMRARRTSS